MDGRTMEERGRSIADRWAAERRIGPIETLSGEWLWVMRSYEGSIATKQEWESARDKVDAFYNEIGPENLTFVKPNPIVCNERPVQVPEKKKRPGYVYLWQADNGLYKIGWSKDPDARIESLGVLLPYALTEICRIPSEDAPVLEADLHETFDPARINGEWFEISPSGVDYLMELAEEARDE